VTSPPAITIHGEKRLATVRSGKKLLTAKLAKEDRKARKENPARSYRFGLLCELRAAFASFAVKGFFRP
jgi:hypothetical protein